MAADPGAPKPDAKGRSLAHRRETRPSVTPRTRSLGSKGSGEPLIEPR